MEANSSIAVRVTGLERAVNRLETLEPAVVKQQVQDLRDDIIELRGELRTSVARVEAKVDSQTKALYTAALSFAGGSLLFAFTMFQLLH